MGVLILKLRNEHCLNEDLLKDSVLHLMNAVIHLSTVAKRIAKSGTAHLRTALLSSRHSGPNSRKSRTPHI